jgi:hypothetical protein
MGAHDCHKIGEHGKLTIFVSIAQAPNGPQINIFNQYSRGLYTGWNGKKYVSSGLFRQIFSAAKSNNPKLFEVKNSPHVNTYIHTAKNDRKYTALNVTVDRGKLGTTLLLGCGLSHSWSKLSNQLSTVFNGVHQEEQTFAN